MSNANKIQAAALHFAFKFWQFLAVKLILQKLVYFVSTSLKKTEGWFSQIFKLTQQPKNILFPTFWFGRA